VEDTVGGDTTTVGSEPPREATESHENGDTNVASLNATMNNAAEEKPEAKNGELVKSDLVKEVADEEDQGEMVVEAAEDTIIY
jgi:hypothetical protein